MAEKATLEAKVYAATPERKLSLKDLLDYFAKHGTLRVSDLHLKAGCPPVYRLDGALQKMVLPQNSWVDSGETGSAGFPRPHPGASFPSRVGAET